MSALSPTPMGRGEYPKGESFDAALPAGTTAGPSTSGLSWSSHASPMLRLEDAVVETVVTHVTRTTTSFAPITLPRIPSPETLSMPSHLSPEQYPLAHEPSPGDMRFFAMNLGGRRVICQEEGASAEESAGEMRGPGWTRVIPSGAAVRDDSEKINLAQALHRAKGKEVRKRPHTHSRVASHNESREAPTPPLTGDGKVRARSPPRKRVRGLEDLTISLDGTAAPLSPLPSPDHEGPSATPGLLAPASAAPSIGSGMELSALFSLPAIVNHFDTLPDKLQQHVLMHLFRRSRLPTIQRLSTFISTALKRDFISLLPAEIAVQILRKVDTRSLAQASRVNRRWRKMIDSERSVWRQRLIDDDLWVGLGTEEEEEQLVKRRFDALDWKRSQPSKASTPSEDEYMDWSGGSRPAAVEIERPVPLKHVYRRRFASERNWLNKGPTHHSFPGHGTNVVTCTQFDREKIVTASDDHSINVYDMKTGALRKRLDGHEGGVWALEYYGDTLVTGSTDRTIRVWDLETMQETHVFHGHTSTVRCLQIIVPVYDEKTGEYQPPYPMFVTGSRDASIRLWKLPKKGEPSYTSPFAAGHDGPPPPEENPYHIQQFEGHTMAVRALAAHGRLVISGSYDCTVRVWDIVKAQCTHVLTGHEGKVYSIVYDRYRRRCASGSMDNTVKVWDVDTGTCLHTLTGHTSLVGLLANSPNYIVSAAADASLRIWDANSHNLKHILGAHGGAITCFAHDETKVVSGSDGSLKLWDIRTGKFVRDLVAGINSVWQVVFRDNVLVAATNRGGNTVFEVFDFGGPEHPSGIDDESLDDLRGPPWKRGNPLEPQTYQVDEVDDYFNFSDPSASEFDAAMMPSSPFQSEQAREVTHDDLDEGPSRRRLPGSRSGVGASELGSGPGSASGSGSRRSTRLTDREPRSARRVAGSSSLGSSGGSTRSRESRAAATIGTATNASASASASASTWNGTASGGFPTGEASSSSSRLSRIQEYRDFRAAREQGGRTPRAGSGVYQADFEVAESAVDDDDEEGGLQHPRESFAPIFDEPMDERDERDEAEGDELEEEDEEV